MSFRSVIPYVGGKHRLAPRLAEICKRTGADMFVDVFGGSAAVTIAAADHFKKLIYNDVDGDLVNLFRVLASREFRPALLKALRWTPPSRGIFNSDGAIYAAGGFSFQAIKDPVERARATFYRHIFCFGGKVRNGGLAISTCLRGTKGNRERIKEVFRYRNSLRRMVHLGELFRSVMIENLDYSEIIRIHGKHPSVVLFIDPPYIGTETYYSRVFPDSAHALLAHQLATCQARVVCTYYRHPLIEKLYPVDQWEWQPIQATKNSCLLKGNKVITDEICLIKK